MPRATASSARRGARRPRIVVAATAAIVVVLGSLGAAARGSRISSPSSGQTALATAFLAKWFSAISTGNASYLLA